MIKKFGIGTLSPLLVLLAVLWSCNIPYLGDKCFGDLILNTLRFPSWSNGRSRIHYTVYYSLLLLFPAFALGVKYKADLYAAIGKWLSGIMIVYLFVSLFFMIV